MNKHEVAAAFEEIAVLMELSGENPFKSRSYEAAARAIEALDGDLDAFVREKRLREIKGVGQAIEEKIEELVSTGKLEFLEKLRAHFPTTLFELFQIPGLGPKRVKQLWEERGVDSMQALEDACKAGKLEGLKGFNAKLQAKILEGIAYARQHQGQHLFIEASAAAEELLDFLREDPAVIRVELAGSLRRHKELIKDIDIVASSAHAKKVMDRFVKAPRVQRITGHGETKSSIVLEPGIAADLRVVTDQEFPFALAHFTGSKEHNVVMRQRAKERGLKLNEYGLFDDQEKCVPCRTEADIFEALGLPFIAPELREDLGEFDAPKLPRLLEIRDLRGLIHCHTTWSDGVDPLEQMVQRAQGCGYEYILITDHSQTAAYAGGLKPETVAAQQKEIDALNDHSPGFRILKGIESDIRLDGALDYEDDVLATFDLVIASVHQKLEMTETEATARVIKAIENPYTDIIGHPTGRLLLQRPGFPLDVDKIFDACIANNVALEINANCKRLDLDWRHLHRGKDKGVKFSIGPDAHRVEGVDFVRFGVGIARKGWLEKDDVINTMGVEELLAWRKSR